MRPSKFQRIAWVGLYGSAILSGGLVLFFFAPDQYRFYPRCALNALTGLKCPGCGGLRATHHLLHGDFLGAWHLNPLIFVVFPTLAVVMGAHLFRLLTGRPLPHPFRHPAWLWTLAVGCILFGVLRNVPFLFSSPASG